MAEGFEEVEAIAPYDALKRAKVDVCLVGVTGVTVAGSHGLRVETDIGVAEVDGARAEAEIVPGGLRGVRNIAASRAALSVIRAAYDSGNLVAAICAAPTVLAKLGILEGRRAVCYPGMEGELGGAKAEPGERVVVDGNVVTSRSAGTAWDFALTVVEILRGRPAAEAVSEAVHYDFF